MKIVPLAQYSSVPCTNHCQEYCKNCVLFAQFLFILLTYDLFSYFVCLHCINNFTPLPFIYLSYDLQTIKMKQQLFHLTFSTKGALKKMITLQVLIIIILWAQCVRIMAMSPSFSF